MSDPDKKLLDHLKTQEELRQRGFIQVTCPHCHGLGHVLNREHAHLCYPCDGRGYTMEQQRPLMLQFRTESPASYEAIRDIENELRELVKGESDKITPEPARDYRCAKHDLLCGDEKCTCNLKPKAESKERNMMPITSIKRAAKCLENRWTLRLKIANSTDSSEQEKEMAEVEARIDRCAIADLEMLIQGFNPPSDVQAEGRGELSNAVPMFDAFDEMKDLINRIAEWYRSPFRLGGELNIMGSMACRLSDRLNTKQDAGK